MVERETLCFLLVSNIDKSGYGLQEKRHFREESIESAITYAKLLNAQHLISEYNAEQVCVCFSYNDLNQVIGGKRVEDFSSVRGRPEHELGFATVPMKDLRVVVSDWHVDAFSNVSRDVYYEFDDITMRSTKRESYGTVTEIKGTFQTKPIVIEKIFMDVFK